MIARFVRTQKIPPDPFIPATKSGSARTTMYFCPAIFKPVALSCCAEGSKAVKNYEHNEKITMAGTIFHACTED